MSFWYSYENIEKKSSCQCAADSHRNASIGGHLSKITVLTLQILKFFNLINHIKLSHISYYMQQRYLKEFISSFTENIDIPHFLILKDIFGAFSNNAMQRVHMQA